MKVTLTCIVRARQRQHPNGVPIKVVGQAAGQRWKELTSVERAPYEALSEASKAEYARLSIMSPVQRVMSAAAAAMEVGMARVLQSMLAGQRRYAIINVGCQAPPYLCWPLWRCG